MPNINATSASGPSARCFEPPMGRLRPTTSGIRGSRSTIPRVDERITRAQNVPRPRATGASASSRHHAGGSVTTLRRSESRLQTDYQWIVRGARLPTGISASAGRDHVRAVLLAIAAGSSDYWHQSLGGRALCVRYDNGAIACRVSPATNDGMDMLKSDAVIELTGDGPRAYSTLRSMTLPNTPQVEPFCSAAAQAAQLSIPHFASTWIANSSAESYHVVIAQHEAALNKSMMEWIAGHEQELGEAAAHIMRTGPTAT